MHIPSEQVQRQVIEVLMKQGGVNMDGEKWGIGELEYEAEMRHLDYRVYKILFYLIRTKINF